MPFDFPVQLLRTHKDRQYRAKVAGRDTATLVNARIHSFSLQRNEEKGLLDFNSIK